jgi:four helix bundle protein
MNAPAKSYRDLVVWQHAVELADRILNLSGDFSAQRGYGLRDQMQRSAISVPSNIAEGTGRGTKKDYIAFLRYSVGSLRELETQVELAKRAKLLTLEQADELFSKCDSVGRLLTRLIQSQMTNSKPIDP